MEKIRMKGGITKMPILGNFDCADYVFKGNTQMSKTTVLVPDPTEEIIPDATADVETAEDQEDAKKGIWRNLRTSTPEHWLTYFKMADGSMVASEVFVANPDRVKEACKKVRMSVDLFNTLPQEAQAVILRNGSALRVAPTQITNLPTYGIRFPGKGPEGWINAEIFGTRRMDQIAKIVERFSGLFDHHAETPRVSVETALQACGFLKIRPNDEKNGFIMVNVKAAEKDRIARDLANASLELTAPNVETADDPSDAVNKNFSDAKIEQMADVVVPPAEEPATDDQLAELAAALSN